MLSRTTHLAYLAAVLGLLAVALGPLLQDGTMPVPASPSKSSAAPPTGAAEPPPSSDTDGLVQLALWQNSAPADGALGKQPGSAPSSGDQKPNRPRPPSRNHDDHLSELPPGDDGALGPELIARCVEVARDINPLLADQLTRKRENKPEEFERLIRQHGRNLMAMAQLKQRDPALYRIKLSEFSQDLQVRKVADDLRQAIQKGNDKEVESLKSQLRTLLQIQLALSIKSRGEHLCRIEEEIEHLREEIKREADNFHATVEGRLQHYMQEPSPHSESSELMPLRDEAPADQD